MSSKEETEQTSESNADESRNRRSLGWMSEYESGQRLLYQEEKANMS